MLTYGRVGLTTAGVAFLAAVFWPFPTLLRADLAGPLNVAPPIAAEALILLLAPGLALLLGGHLASSVVVEDRSMPLAITVVISALLGGALGVLVGPFLARIVFLGSMPSLGQGTQIVPSLTLLASLLRVLSVGIAVAVGVLAGVAIPKYRFLSVTATQDGDSGPPFGRGLTGRVVGLLIVVGLCGLAVGFAVVIHPFNVVYGRRWTVLSSSGYAWAVEVGVPLVASAFAAAARIIPIDRRLLGGVVGAALVGTVAGSGLAYQFALANEGDLAIAVFQSSVAGLLLEGVGEVAVIVLAVLAGSALLLPGDDVRQEPSDSSI